MKSIFNLVSYVFVTEGLIQCISLGDHDFTTDTETVSIKRGYLDAS